MSNPESRTVTPAQASIQSRNGSAYGRPPQHSNKLLTEVGPGTPCGELMRRYWQPIAASADVQDMPRKVRVLGEELVLFRDRNGRAGLLYPRCMHHGTSLYYGRIEAGLRCCYVMSMVMKIPKGAPGPQLRINGKSWGEMTEAERQRFPGDFEAQSGQGPISLHSEEHLVTSDRGIMMQRRILEKQIEIVAAGGDPLGVSYDPAKALFSVRSGNFFRAARAPGQARRPTCAEPGAPAAAAPASASAASPARP